MPTIHFFFNDTATTEIYTLSLHDALPICSLGTHRFTSPVRVTRAATNTPSPTVIATRVRRDTAPTKGPRMNANTAYPRSEEHTSELQSRQYLVFRLLLEKKTQEMARP